MEALINMSPETGWKVTPIVLEEDVNAQIKELKTRAIKNIVVYMHIEEHVKLIVDNVNCNSVYSCYFPFISTTIHGSTQCCFAGSCQNISKPSGIEHAFLCKNRVT